MDHPCSRFGLPVSPANFNPRNFLVEYLKAMLAIFLLGPILAVAQDPGMMAAQQAAQQAQTDAMQAAQQANQQAMQASQQANQQAMQNAQDTAPAVGVWCCTQPPKFSVNPGVVDSGTTVRLKTSTHYAVIYYTTDGWSPTPASRRYTGPITIKHTMELQAIAVAPNTGRSLIASAKYTVPGSPKKIEPIALSGDGVLHAGTRLHLVTASTVTSKTAQIGDRLQLLLDQDVLLGDHVVLPKGTPVVATITQADPAGHAGVPGDVAFQIHGLTIDGREIPLQGGETLEGANHYTRAKGLLVVPVVGVAALALHGEEAEIRPGMTLTAAVAGDTALQP